jgi:hypothetical protein
VAQKMAEAEQLQAIERERARARQGARTDIVETLPPSDFGKTRDKVAAATGIGSGRTYDKAGDEVAQKMA